jgi:hypothetical protein
MRNLKRALSLTLASVMLLGMMVIGTSAASYPDVDKDNNVEAIEVLQAVGVMQGDDKGNFDPDRSVSRNEMAIIMAKLLDLDYNYYSESCPFWDVPDYAKPYVGACYANGIVSGYNATQYGGADTVTAVQAASMMMRALGYFQYESDYKEGFVIATVKQASKIGLFKDINANQDSPLTRDQVAQLALNTLETGMVEAQKSSSDITIGSGDTAVTINGEVNYVYVTSGESYADAIKDVNATSIGVQNDNLILELGEKLYEGSLKKFGDKARSVETDDFGRPAVRWVYENKDVGTYVEKGDLEFSYTAKAAKGDMYTKIGSSVADSLRADDGKYLFEVWVDGTEVRAPDAKQFFEKNSSSAAGAKDLTGKGTGVTGNGVLTEVFVIDGDTANDPDTVRIVMTNTYLLKATSDYNSTKETVNVEAVEINTDDDPDDYPIILPPMDTSISSDDFNVTDVKEDDYLLATWSYKADGYATVEPAELFTGTVSEYTVTDYVIMDSTKYSYNKLVGVDEKSEEFTINQDAKVVLDNYGYIIFVDEAISTNSFVYIQKAGSPSGLNKKGVAAAYFGDGTYAEIDVKKVVEDLGGGRKAEHTDGAWLSNNSNVHGWYTYIKDSNDQYTLTEASLSAGRSTDNVKNAAVTPADEATQIVFNSKVRFLASSTDTNIHAKGIRGNANTIFLTLDDDDEVTVATGVENAPDVHIGGNQNAVAADKVEISWVEKDGYAQYVFIDVSDPAAKGTVDSASSAADYLFILKSTGNKTVVDGDTYYKFKVVIDGEETERFIEESNVATVGELRYNVKTNSKDYITKATAMPGKATQTVIDLDGSDITQKGKTITINGNTYLTTSKSELNLVVGKGVTELLRDSGADYELYQKTTAGTIAGLVGQLEDGKGVDGKAYVVVDEAGSEEIEVLWVYIDDVSDAAEPGTPIEGGLDASLEASFNAPTFQNAAGQAITEASAGEVIKIVITDKTVRGRAASTAFTEGEWYDVTIGEDAPVKVQCLEDHKLVVSYTVKGDDIVDNKVVVTVSAIEDAEAPVGGTDAEKVAAAKTAVSGMTGAEKTIANASTGTEAAAIAAAKTAVEAKITNGVTVAVATKTGETYTAPTTADVTWKATVTLTSGEATDTVDVTFTLKGSAASTPTDAEKVAAAKTAIEGLVNDGAKIAAVDTALDADGIKAKVAELITEQVLNGATVDTTKGTNGYTWTTVTPATNGSHDKTDDSKLTGTAGTVTVTIALKSGTEEGTATITALPVEAKAHVRTDAEKVETGVYKIGQMANKAADVTATSASEQDALDAITAVINTLINGNGTAAVKSTASQNWSAPAADATVTWNVDITVTSGNETDATLTNQAFTLTGKAAA